MGTSLRLQAARCKPFWGLAVGVKGAHRGRLAAATQRAGFKIVGSARPRWVLCFEDVYGLTREESTYREATLGFIGWLVVLNAPPSWKESKGWGSHTPGSAM